MKKTARELMTAKLAKIREDDSISEAVAKIAEDRETIIACVVDADDRLVGIITPKRVLKTLAVRTFETIRYSLFLGPGMLHSLITAKQVKDIMNAPVSVRPEDNIDRAIELMLEIDILEVPVVDNSGLLLGVINYNDVISSVGDYLKESERKEE